MFQAKVVSRRYNTASEVIREALRAQTAIGYAQLEAGEAAPVTSKKALAALALARRGEVKAAVFFRDHRRRDEPRDTSLRKN